MADNISHERGFTEQIAFGITFSGPPGIRSIDSRIDLGLAQFVVPRLGMVVNVIRRRSPFSGRLAIEASLNRVFRRHHPDIALVGPEYEAEELAAGVLRELAFPNLTIVGALAVEADGDIIEVDVSIPAAVEGARLVIERTLRSFDVHYDFV